MDGLCAFVDASAQYFIPNLTAYQTKLKLLDGDKAAAHEWLNSYYVTETNHIEFFRSFQHFTTARAYIATGNTERALHYLLLLKKFWRKLKPPSGQVRGRGHPRGALLGAWPQKEAETQLMETLAVLQPYGFIRVVCRRRAGVVPILKRILSKLSDNGYKGPLTRAYLSEVMLAAHSFAGSHVGYIAGLAKG